MPQQNKFSMKPGIIGALMSVLLIVSFFLPRIWEKNTTVESFNTVLIVVIMCIAAKLIRETSELYGENLWNNKVFPLLMTVPVFNIIMTAVQFVFPGAFFMQHPILLTLLVLSSLPAFCCYYFTAIWLHLRRDRRLIISSGILDVIGLIYVLIRLSDRVIVPSLSLRGTEISAMLDKLVSVSPLVSLVIYIMSFFSFIICAKIFNETDKKTV